MKIKKRIAPVVGNDMLFVILYVVLFKKRIAVKIAKIVVRKDVCGRKGVCEKWCFCLWRKARFVEFFYLEILVEFLSSHINLTVFIHISRSDAPFTKRSTVLNSSWSADFFKPKLPQKEEETREIGFFKVWQFGKGLGGSWNFPRPAAAL